MHTSLATLGLFLVLIISCWSIAESAGCGAYNPTFYTCCNGKLTSGGGKACCNTVAYDSFFYTCCNGVLTSGNGKACCGTTAYDSRFYTCCNGKLTSGTGLACGK